MKAAIVLGFVTLSVGGLLIWQSKQEDKYCIDIVRQVQAARAALASLESVIIDDHIQTCVHHAITEGGTSDREAKVAELVDVMRGVKK